MSEQSKAKQKTYDVIIIGIGPAGLTASIYASRYKLSNLVIGKTLAGELSHAKRVENYPGFISISGIELGQKWQEQAEKLGADILIKEVGRIDKLKEEKARFLVTINKDESYKARALIVATGSERRRLNIPGEKEYMGKGVTYCTTCDSPFFKDKTVVLVGGSDSAVSGAIHTAQYAKKTIIIYRGEKLRAEPIWLEEWQKLEQQDKGEVIYNTNILEIIGDNTKVTAVKLDNPYQGKNILKTDGVFVEIGGVPGTTLVQPLGVDIDEAGYVKVEDTMETNIHGLFCAGDMITKSKVIKQATIAMGQGARAAASAFKFLKKESAPQIRGI
jgi:thioredoxin reductase (NADPH)